MRANPPGLPALRTAGSAGGEHDGREAGAERTADADVGAASCFRGDDRGSAAVRNLRRTLRPATEAVAAAPRSAAKPPAPIATGTQPAADADAGVLFARKSPLLNVETKGPRRIAIGKEAAYEVTILNSGEAAAEEVTVFVSLPGWADISGVQASAGSARAMPSRGAAAVEPLQWSVGRLEPKERAEAVLAAGAAAEPAVRFGGPLGLQAGGLAGHD